MATTEFIYQRFNGYPSIKNKIIECFSLGGEIESGGICVAFARYDGVEEIFNQLSILGNSLSIFVGINNGITSVQALHRLFQTNAKIYTINTKNSVTFHPKVYWCENAEMAKIIIGSANLTSSGLNSNIECCTCTTYFKNNEDDLSSYNTLKSTILSWPITYSNGITHVNNIEILSSLLSNNLLENENIHFHYRHSNGIITVATQSTENPAFPVISPFHSHSGPAFSSYPIQTQPINQNNTTQYELVWESNELTERDLNIPSHTTRTNPTGSMGLKKGNYDNIDFRSYFRNNVFQHLNWISYRARNNSIQEETTGSFFIKILDHLYGNYTLRLTHDPRKNTRSYEQHNMMTHLHWGTACSIIANAELLNKHLRIYREVNNPQQFLIEIY